MSAKRHVLTGYGHNIPMPPIDPKRPPVPYEFVEYPKMLTMPATVEYIEEWKKKNAVFDKPTGESSLTQAAPRKGQPVPVLATEQDVEHELAEVVGEPIVVNNPEQERLARELHNLPVPVRKQPGVAEVPMEDEAEELRAENERLRKLLDKGKPAALPRAPQKVSPRRKIAAARSRAGRDNATAEAPVD